MESPIYITPQDIINVVLALCGAIITISGAGTIVIRAIAKAREPNKKQDERISALEDQMQKIEGRLQLGNKHFESDSERMTHIENDVRSANKVIIESLKALTTHYVDGNNKEELVEASRQLDAYLLTKL